MPGIKRRQFISFLGSAAAWPVVARGQQAMPVVGYLGSATPEEFAPQVRAFHQGLNATGFVEGRNVAIEYRWARNQLDRLPALAADLAGLPVSVIATNGGISSALAVKAATRTIPIVFVIGNDPVSVGLVASLNQPGGNITGATTLGVEVAPKRLELLHELIPTATGFAFLVNPTSPSAENQTSAIQAAARTLGLDMHVLYARTEQDIDAAFARLRQMHVDGLVISVNPFYSAQVEQLGALTARHAMPAVYLYREFAAAGGLMSYGPHRYDSVRIAGTYVGRILKGERPANLPVQQSTNVELIINLKSAKVLGLTVPLSLRGRADELIE